MYEIKKKLERYLRVNLLEPGPRLMEKGIYRAAVSQRLRNTTLHVSGSHVPNHQENYCINAAPGLCQSV